MWVTVDSLFQELKPFLFLIFIIFLKKIIKFMERNNDMLKIFFSRNTMQRLVLLLCKHFYIFISSYESPSNLILLFYNYLQFISEFFYLYYVDAKDNKITQLMHLRYLYMMFNKQAYFYELLKVLSNLYESLTIKEFHNKTI